MAVKYTITATKDGYKMECLTGEKVPGSPEEGHVIGLSLESEGGHDALERFYAEAAKTWDEVRAQYSREQLKRIPSTTLEPF